METLPAARFASCEFAQSSSARKGLGTALVGCAGWSITREMASSYLDTGSQLQRYSSALGAVEINTSFYRSHRPSTYARWAASVPDDFRFSVKLPRLISHQLRLSGIEQALAQFVGEAGALNEKLGCVLVQLPPTGAYVAPIANQFFTLMRQNFSCMVSCEARHPSWFGGEATAMLQAHGVTRVQADPMQVRPEDFVPTTQESYRRLHGSPKVYYSSYSEKYLTDLRTQLLREKHLAWVVFDNTASGAAMRNALTLRGSDSAT